MSYYLVVGLGKTGLACTRFLLARGEEVVVTDSREQPPGASELLQINPDLKHHFGEFKQSVFDEAHTCVVSPGVSIHTPVIANAKANGVKIVGDIQLFAEAINQKIIAITGTNGKSTVTSLVGLMLKAQGFNTVVAGNIGQAVLDEIDPSADCYVLELSSFQLETTTNLGAEVACILNLSPDHLDRYDSYQHYIQAKKRIFQQAKHVIVNANDQATFPDGEVAQTCFTLDAPSAGEWGITEDHLSFGEERLLNLHEMKLKGRQNWQNALAAAAIAYQAGAEFDAIIKALTAFPGLTHRCQWVRELNGVQWYNDSKGTNIGASFAAINGLGANIPGKIVLLLGGQAKGGDFRQLNPVITQYVKDIIYFGEDAPLIETQIEFDRKSKVANMVEAVALAHSHAKQGDIVLLSPGCASFDMYQNFEARGEHFMNLVSELS